MAGFCNSAGGLQTPNLNDCRPESSKVSGGSLKYSRFWETAIGDRVRSALRGRACSVTRQTLRLLRRENGTFEPALRAETKQPSSIFFQHL
jgi:hypothetical protein